MANSFSPMEGSGFDADMLTGSPAVLSRQRQETVRDQKRFEREQAQYRLLRDLGAGGGEVLRRLVQRAFARMQELSLVDKQLRLILELIQSVVGPDIQTHDQYVRHVLMEFFVETLGVPLPREGHQPPLPPQPAPVLSSEMAQAIEAAILAQRYEAADSVIQETPDGGTTSG